MTIDEAIAILQAMDQATEDPFSPDEREAIRVVGAAGWSGDIQADDPRLLGLPDVFRDLISVMKTKRIVQ